MDSIKNKIASGRIQKSEIEDKVENLSQNKGKEKGVCDLKVKNEFEGCREKLINIKLNSKLS